MPNLMYVYLDNNALTGQIPACIGGMTYLKSLHLFCNNIEG